MTIVVGLYFFLSASVKPADSRAICASPGGRIKTLEKTTTRCDGEMMEIVESAWPQKTYEALLK